ncbi:MAG: hypothetical protein SVS85_00880 [Candidatus Nanohaloarchaea archaeon]|nr:hypothetical protein [Candidatus Nanohaloarchaea archaeon]
MVSALLAFAGGFAIGAFAGIGAFLLYMRYRTRKQLERMENQMGEMFDTDGAETGELEEDL